MLKQCRQVLVSEQHGLARTPAPSLFLCGVGGSSARVCQGWVLVLGLRGLLGSSPPLLRTTLTFFSSLFPFLFTPWSLFSSVRQASCLLMLSPDLQFFSAAPAIWDWVFQPC